MTQDMPVLWFSKHCSWCMNMYCGDMEDVVESVMGRLKKVSVDICIR